MGRVYFTELGHWVVTAWMCGVSWGVGAGDSFSEVARRGLSRVKKCKKEVEEESKNRFPRLDSLWNDSLGSLERGLGQAEVGERLALHVYPLGLSGLYAIHLC